MRWPGGDARGRVAARRAGHPVVEVARGERDVARRAGRAARRVDPDDLGPASRRDARRSGSRACTVALSSCFSVSGSSRDLREPARAAAATRARPRPASRGRRPSARRGRRAGCGSTRRRARAAPPTGGVSTSGSSITCRLRGARTRSPPRPAPPCRKPIGCSLLLGEVREQAGGAREDRDRLDGVGREAEVEHHRRDRHRDVHRERLAPGLGDRVAEAAREQDVRPAHAAGVGELEDPLGARVDRPVNRMAEARQPCRRPRGSRAPPRRATAAGARAGDHPRLRLLEQPRARLGGAEDDRARSRGSPPRRRPAASRGRRRASSGPRRWSASSRARRSRRAAGRGRSAAPRSARGR